MVINSDQIARIRVVTLGLTGLVCLSYAVLALVLNRPDPMPWWVPGAFGVASGLVIYAAASIAPHNDRKMAMDELSREVSRRAAAHAYWVSLALFVLAFGTGFSPYFDTSAVVAAFGTSIAAAYLILFVWHDTRLG